MPTLLNIFGNDPDIEVIASLNSVSPLSYIIDDRKYLSFDINEVEDADYIEMMHDLLNIDISQLKSMTDYDLVIIDLSTLRLMSKKYTDENGNTFYHTSKSKYSKYKSRVRDCLNKLGYKISSDSIIDPLSMNDFQLDEYVLNFVVYINSIFEKEKVRFVDIRNTTEYISKGGNISVTPNFVDACKFNQFYERVSNIFKNNGIRYISSPDNIIANEKYGKININSTTPYYNDYIKLCTLNLNNNDDCYDKYMCEYDREVKPLTIEPIIRRAEKQHGNRKILLIGKITDLPIIEKISKIKINSVINYSRSTTTEELQELLQKYEGQYKEYYFIIPSFHNKGNVEKVMLDIHFTRSKDYAGPIRKSMILHSFVGRYIDVYDNIVDSYKPIDLDLSGAGAYLSRGPVSEKYDLKIKLQSLVSIDISKNVITGGLSITSYPGSSLIIKDDTTFADNCHIRMSFFTTTIVGKDCMFSSQVVLFCGDGHAIYDIDTGINCNYCGQNDKKCIIIGNHVWLGYQSFILAKTNIDDGSIVGARSLTNKSYPNNCIIVGSPAKVVRTNIAWGRDPLEYNLDRENIEQFINDTEGI